MHAGFAHALKQPFTEHRVKAAQRQVFTQGQGSLAAQAVQHPGEFHRDIPGTDHQCSFRTGLQLKKPVTGDAELRARQVRHLRVAAGGDDDVRRGVCVVIDLQGVRGGESRLARDVCDPGGG